MKLVTATALLTVLSAGAASAQDWKEDYQVIRIGVTSAENQKDRLQRYSALETYLEDELGIDAEIFTASSYAGTIQAMAANQIEFAFFGSAGYAAVWNVTDGGVIPLLTSQTADGSTGYYSIIVTRCDSGIESIDDLEGKVLAFADPNSTSGYAVPYFNLVQQGYDPETFFEAIPFSGSHEAGVMAVVRDTYPAAATYRVNEDSGTPQRMVDKGMIEAGVICPIWESPEITSGPFTARANLPQGLIEDMTAAIEAFPEKDPEGFAQITGADKGDVNPPVGYVRVDHDRYQWIIDMRDWLRNQRRGG